MIPWLLFFCLCYDCETEDGEVSTVQAEFIPQWEIYPTVIN